MAKRFTEALEGKQAARAEQRETKQFVDALEPRHVVQTAVVILRRQQVEAFTGMSRSTIYRGMAAGTFPQRYAIGARSVGWSSHDVEKWIAGVLAAGQAKGTK